MFMFPLDSRAMATHISFAPHWVMPSYSLFKAASRRSVPAGQDPHASQAQVRPQHVWRGGLTPPPPPSAGQTATAASQSRLPPQLMRSGGLTLPPVSAAARDQCADNTGRESHGLYTLLPISTTTSYSPSPRAAAFRTTKATGATGFASATPPSSTDKLSTTKQGRSPYIFLCRYGCEGIYKTSNALQNHMQNFLNIVDDAKVIGTCNDCGRQSVKDATWFSHGGQGCEAPSEPDVVARWEFSPPTTAQEKAATCGKRFGALTPSGLDCTEEDLSKEPPVAPKNGYVVEPRNASGTEQEDKVRSITGIQGCHHRLVLPAKLTSARTFVCGLVS
ncbi:hypothetical protein Tdes44962_MAKER01908 [Teratosphaeria destructans]|uniref:Uncharacterized protein n=1 Tax=Teratosphaeria destructans TaxID=418781 RepID=A0A9W7W4E1_9PEZI|nr:hypothetical protein Tdes44962_MAKER01908 [Teratosphaeria destructans]